MAIQRFNAVGGYSTGITATAVIDSLGNITGVGATFSGLIRANAGISAAGATLSGGINILGGFTAGAGSGNCFMMFNPVASSSNGGLWLRDGDLQIGGSLRFAGSGNFGASPNSEICYVYGQIYINNSYNYQSGKACLRLNASPTHSVPILAAYKQTAEGTQINATYTATNMVAGIDQNGALFSTAGVSAAGGITFTNNVQANGYILSSNARSWFL